MKKITGWMVAFCVVMFSVPAHAEEPSSFLAAARSVVDYLDPTPEIGVFATFKDLGDGETDTWESFAGISGALWKLESHDIELGSLRLGGQFEGDRKLYTTIGVSGIGLAKRYLSEETKAKLSPGFVAKVWEGLDKYGSAGLGIGLASVQDAFADDYTLSDHLGVVATLGIRIPL